MLSDRTLQVNGAWGPVTKPFNESSMRRVMDSALCDPGGVAVCSHGWSEVRPKADFRATRGRERTQGRTAPEGRRRIQCGFIEPSILFRCRFLRPSGATWAIEPAYHGFRSPRASYTRGYTPLPLWGKSKRNVTGDVPLAACPPVSELNDAGRDTSVARIALSRRLQPARYHDC